MNGPQCFREAERLAELAISPAGAVMAQDGYDFGGAAQAYATLALAAAIANTKAVAEFPLVGAPDGYDAPKGTLTWPEVLQ